MRVKTDELPDESRVYLFPASRKFYPQETSSVEKKAEFFCSSMEHTTMGFELMYDRFLVFFVSNETPFSIEQNDDLVSWIQSIEQEYDMQLLDKVNVCFKQGEYVQRKEIPEFRKMIKNRSVSAKTIVFDPTVNTKMEFRESWERPAGESWLSHLF